MAAGGDEALKRLGGGRWATRDGRFTIEPESGTWVVVDSTATDELGLPLVRGPYPSLTAARAAIEEARLAPAPTSPLAEELARAEEAAPKASAGRGRRREAERPGAIADEPVAAPDPPPPPEPVWLTALRAPRRRAAREAIDRLVAAGAPTPEAEAVAHREFEAGEPAIARWAIARQLRAAARSARTPAAAVREAARLLGGGESRELGVRWRIVDGEGRELGELEPAE